MRTATWSAPSTALVSLHADDAFNGSGYNIVAGVAVPKAVVEFIRFNGDGTLTVPAIVEKIAD
jgi:hypothetical protein